MIGWIDTVNKRRRYADARRHRYTDLFNGMRNRFKSAAATKQESKTIIAEVAKITKAVGQLNGACNVIVDRRSITDANKAIKDIESAISKISNAVSNAEKKIVE